MVKKIDTNKYELDIVIKWSDLNRLWIESKKVKGFKSFVVYMFNYGKYSSLANFGAKIINEYHIPFSKINILYEENKK